MAVIYLTNHGSFSKTYNFLRRILKRSYYKGLESLAQEGVRALSEATPVDTGKTAASWQYSITDDGKTVSIKWFNTNEADGIPIVVLLYYGHATKHGGYVQGRDFISPAIQPIFDKISNKAWEEVTSDE